MLFLAIAQMVSVPAPSPPVIAPVVARVAPLPASPGPTMTMDVDVEVRGNSEVLWTGRMRVSDRQGASFSRQQSNADPSRCVSTESYYGAGERTALSINLSATRRGSSDGGLELRASWERPGDNENCLGRRGTRTVGVAETVWIEAGREQTIRADGGLTIRLRRR